jgi:hypothetical protein
MRVPVTDESSYSLAFSTLTLPLTCTCGFDYCMIIFRLTLTSNLNLNSILMFTPVALVQYSQPADRA